MTDDGDGNRSPDGLRYDVVFWDLGGVVVALSSVREGYATFVEEITDEYDLAADDALGTWKSTLGDHFKGRDGTEYRTARTGYEKATAALFDGDPPDDWRDRFAVATDDALRPEDGAVETVHALADAGLEQVVVSDIDAREAENILSTFGIRARFAHVTTSEAVGYTKPDERMFRDALAAVDAPPEGVLMVGDRYTHDVVGAADVGIDTAGFREDAWGPETDHEIDDLRDLLAIVGVEDA